MAAHLANIQKTKQKPTYVPAFHFFFFMANVLIIFICNELAEENKWKIYETRDYRRLVLKMYPIPILTFQGLYPHAFPSS